MKYMNLISVLMLLALVAACSPYRGGGGGCLHRLIVIAGIGST